MSALRGAVEESTLRMLQNVPIFSELTDRQLRKLARDAKERSFEPGDVVVRQGEVGIGFYLVLEGQVEVRRKSRKLATLGPGECFGEMALFDDEPRSADVVAATPSRCLVLSKWEFWGFANAEPKVLRGILQQIARRLRATDQSLSE